MNCSSAADYARITGLHRTTIVEYIKKGKINARKKKKPNEKYRIFEKYFVNKYIKQLKKQNKKQGKSWTDTEIYVLKRMWDKDLTTVSKILNRSKSAILCKKWRIVHNYRRRSNVKNY